MYWDKQRAPLLPGVEEPLTAKAIEIPDIDDLLFRLVTIEVVTQVGRGEASYWQIDPGGFRPQMKEARAGWVSPVPNSEQSWSWKDVQV